MIEESKRLLVIKDLSTGYGRRRVLNAVTLDISAGEIVALIGHNGAGKSTLLKAIFGILPAWEGSEYFEGELLKNPSPQMLIKAGVAYVPQGNCVFSDLTVRENLEIGQLGVQTNMSTSDRFHRVFKLFPALKSLLRYRAGSLSGGEKQMLALSNILMSSPRLILLDEPSLGLAPKLATEVIESLQSISHDLGTAILVVEQKVREVLRISRRVCILRNGNVSFFGLSESLRDTARLRDAYL